MRLTKSLLSLDNDVQTVGIAVAGWVDPSRRSVLFAAHLPWRREPVADRLSARIGMPVVLENDARAATWAEYRFGVGQNLRDFAVVTVGSGIGCGIVADGRLLRGAHGLAGELGHSVVEPDGPPCPCGRRGCVDILASGQALERRFQPLRPEALQIQGEPSFVKDDAPVAGAAITMAARAGDPRALQAFADIGHLLGRGVADLVMCLDPEAVIPRRWRSGGGRVATRTHRGILAQLPGHARARRADERRARIPGRGCRRGRRGTFGLIRGWGFGGTGLGRPSLTFPFREQVGGGPDTWASFSAYQRRQRREGDHRAHRPRCDRRRAPERSASSHSRQPRGGGSLRRTYCRLCTPGDGEPVRCDPSLSRLRTASGKRTGPKWSLHT